MAGDDSTSDSSGGFDDWLDEEPGPDTDPYALLGNDDPEGEISDWMAFTKGDESKDAATPADDREAGQQDQAEAEVFADFDDNDVTGEIDVVDSPPASTTIDAFEFDGGGKPDTEEIPIVAGADVLAASVTNASQEPVASTLDDPDEIVEMQAIVAPDTDPNDAESGDNDDDDDTGDMDVIVMPVDAGTATPSSLSDVAETEELDETGPVAESFELTQENYLHTATTEHAGLAAAIADAEDEDTEQVALAAPIPGLESTVVGFEDVVQAEGHGRVRARGSGDLVARIVTGVVLIVALVASLVWQPALLALATVVFVVGAGEFYTALTRTGKHPIGLFGFVGIIGATVGAFVWGSVAIPISFVLVAAALLLYYAVVPGKSDPMGNLALTVTVMVWVGLGAYAMLIAVSDDYRPLILAVVVLVAGMDIAQYFFGRALGRHPLSPWVSPKKTVEGLIGGVVVAFSLGALLHFFPPFELTSGLALGAAVAVLVPLGDLAMSAAKRSLELKDMGSILPGHGGFLDRIDGLLFVIPAAWAIFLWAGLL